MSRVLSPDRRPAVRAFLIAAAAVALLPAPAAARLRQKPGYDATQAWPAPTPPAQEQAPAPVPEGGPRPVPAPTPALPSSPAPDPGPVPAPAPAPAPPPPPPPATGAVTVSWEAPTQRIDDSPLENLAGFRVYYGAVAGAYTSKLEVNTPSLTSVVISSLPEGTYWFVVTAYDAEGLESVYSEAASKYVSS
jgi:hypothetical protein